MNISDLFTLDQSFASRALAVYRHQYEHNIVYQRFCDALRVKKDLASINDIPLLPIEAFKEVDVRTDANLSDDAEELVFHSSGTGGMERSVHWIGDHRIYHESVLNGFKWAYPDLQDPIIWAYLPHYVDNPHSSLVHMLKLLITQDNTGKSQFLPLNEPLDEALIAFAHQTDRTVIIFGAAFGLMDMIDERTYDLPDQTVVIETGGMKTYRREMAREVMHQRLAEGLHIPIENIHSEYGMAELVSQAYAKEQNHFKSPPWMQVTIHDPDDPLRKLPPGEEGLIGVIDLGNWYSCSFILTGDRGVANPDGSFNVLGRWNPENLRGCNFLIEEER